MTWIYHGTRPSRFFPSEFYHDLKFVGLWDVKVFTDHGYPLTRRVDKCVSKPGALGLNGVPISTSSFFGATLDNPDAWDN